MSAERRLAARFAQISTELLSETSEDLTLDAVVRRAREVVPGCDSASISLLKRRRRAETVAASDAETEHLDSLQYSLREGPCLDAAFEEGAVVVSSVPAESRWPAWAEAATTRGLGSVVAVRLHAREETLGALNLYSRTVGAFDADAVDIALIFAAHATGAMHQARLVTGLEAALESRHLIGVAQGVLATRYDISYDRAFAVLNRFSNDRNLKLRAVAALVADARGLPTDDLTQELDLR
jgi:GAF domain-containing protein